MLASAFAAPREFQRTPHEHPEVTTMRVNEALAAGCWALLAMSLTWTLTRKPSIDQYTDLSCEDLQSWRALADDCAEGLFAIGASRVGSVTLATDATNSQFTVDAPSDFVRARTQTVNYGTDRYLETRYVVLGRDTFPRLHEAYDALAARGRAPAIHHNHLQTAD